MIIEIGEIEVVLSRKHIKNLNLRISTQGEVRVSAPIGISLDVIHSYLQSKQAWIIEGLRRLQASSIPSPLTLETGEFLFFLGKSYELLIYLDIKQKCITIDEHGIHCFIPAKASFKEKHTLLHNWYRHQMQCLLPELFKKWEAIIGVKINEWRIKAMKTRWGSCNTLKKRIWLNLYLIQKPLVCLEYVVVHELVHLLEASHNRRFYSLMNEFMSDWKSYKKQLEESSDVIFR